MKRKRAAARYWVEVKGQLYARLQYKNDDGKYRTKYRRISDKRVARRVVEEMRQEFENHGAEVLHSDKLLFEDLAGRFKETKLVKAEFQNGVKIHGRRSLVSATSSLKVLLDHFGGRKVRSIKVSDLEAYKQKRLRTPTRLGTPRKIASVNRELELLRAMFNFGIQNEWLIRSPFTLTKGMISTAAEVKRDRILTFEEEKRLLDVCIGRRKHLRPFLICALDTAMRRGEIFKMRWRDVDFFTNQIFIPQTNTKTEQARIVGITDRLREELGLLWEGSTKNHDDLVFGITNTIKTAFLAAIAEAGINGFRLHDCRHTATTRMIAAGAPHTEVMKITGHSQMTTFLRYLNTNAESANRTANHLSVYLAKKEAEAVQYTESVS